MHPTKTLLSYCKILIGIHRKIKPLHIISIITAEVAVYLVAIEATVDKFFANTVNIRWSLITACFLISTVAFIEAIQYVINVNKKK